MTTKPSKKVDLFIDNLSAPIKEIAIRLREIVFETSPDIQEKIKWGMPSYIENGMVCYIQTAKNHVNFGFYFGAILTDRDSLLEGTGKKMRHIKIKKIEDIQQDQYAALIQEAIELET
ncbi:DUF1801 domain-containing protein [Virgibacillus necropolis]|uniref:YdhG-like domain-containing protein n=1 Tax=Virgibacillus necropolis TaxID=163877 RepID=A0A221M7B4_9BACI|nr:DUF1801 domain-containing protein [Virgibacillus necropolis]ASN03527.1 hypothetical protein CFK40_00065 [Virgibacillus necropolis]